MDNDSSQSAQQPDQQPATNPVPPEPVQQFAAEQPVTPAPTDPYQQPQPTYQQPVQQLPLKDPGHGIGLASLITSLLGLAPIGIILGIIGISKSKKAGYKTNVMALIGLIWGIILLVIAVPFIALTVMGFKGAQAVAQDTASIADQKEIHSKLEVYYNDNGSYPTTISTKNLVGLNPLSLIDYDGTPIEIGDGHAKTLSEAEAHKAPSESIRYQYIPYDCIADECGGYILRVYIEKPSSTSPNPLTEYGLNNS